ncbi:hypothetical protein [Nannocystis pusilla]|nr:hypothetical protein [Nannocystis pusilla]
MWNADRELGVGDGMTTLCQKPNGAIKPLLGHRIALMVTPQ